MLSMGKMTIFTVYLILTPRFQNILLYSLWLINTESYQTFIKKYFTKVVIINNCYLKSSLTIRYLTVKILVSIKLTILDLIIVWIIIFKFHPIIELKGDQKNFSHRIWSDFQNPPLKNIQHYLAIFHFKYLV